MDLDFSRPRFRARPLVVTGSQKAVMTALPSSVSTPVVPVQATGGATVREPVKIDFAAGARAFKRSRLKASVVHGLVVAGLIAGVVLALLAAVGVWVNRHYAGRALPYTYVGNMSVGGLSEAEVRALLDERAKTMSIILQDGGLRHVESPAKLGIRFDTATASRRAMHGNLQLLSYLQRKRVEVPVVVDEKAISAYVAQKINGLQIRPSDAQIVKERGKLVVQPEVIGFQSDSSFVARSLKLRLPTMDDVTINANVETLKPKIYASQLADDLERARAVLKAAVSVRYMGATYKPTDKQKFDWLRINTSSFDGSPQITFDKDSVRKYVTKIMTPSGATSHPDALDVDRATVQLLASLTSGASSIVDLK